MSTKNKQIALRLYEEVWNERKLNVVDELIFARHVSRKPVMRQVLEMVAGARNAPKTPLPDPPLSI
jgi:hypothetical protein